MKIIWLVALILLGTLSPDVAMAYKYKAGDLGSPDGFICHPDWQYFTASDMASNFTADRTRGDAPFTVKFYDTSYGEPEIWSWDFGDGNTSEDQNPIHTYLEPGSYDVSLKISKAYSYETTLASYNLSQKGQFTDLNYASTDRQLNYINVSPTGSGTDQPVPGDFYPEPKKAVILPSGETGVVGNAQFDAATITITPSTQKGYTDTLNLNGAYSLTKFTPYNDAY